MKHSELRQLIREEIQKSLIKENTGLITFEQVKQACIDVYNNIVDSYDKTEIDDADNIEELVSILDGMGFNGYEAYDFIFDSILKK
jgi:hypothetical protein